MKPTITFILAFFSFTLFAQVDLNKTYNFSATLSEIDQGEYKFYVMDVPLKQCRIYNENHTLYKTIDLDVPAGYYLDDIKYVTRKTFNTNDNIELLYIYYKVDLIDGQSIYDYGLVVVDETGNKLLDLPDGGFAEIKKSSEGYKLLTYQYIWYDYYYLVYTNIYSLGGTLKSTLVAANEGLKVFPNPFNEELNIQLRPSGYSHTNLKVLDIQGRPVMQEELLNGADIHSLNTENLTSGTYILKVDSEEGMKMTRLIEKK